MTKPTREMVEAKVRQLFPQHDVADIMKLLDEYRTTYPERDRVQLAILKLCDGNIINLRKQVAIANFDYRDVLGYAEYPNQIKAGFNVQGGQVQQELAKKDMQQYLDWLNDTSGNTDHSER